KASFDDQAVSPPAHLALLVDQAGVKHLSSDPSELPTDINVQMSVPGVAQSIRATGAATPMSATKTLDVKIVADGVKPDAIKPYLDAAGVESQLKSATMTCDLHASVAPKAGGQLDAEAKVSNIKFTDGQQELFTFEGMSLAGATIDPADSRVRVETIDIVG